MRIVKSFHMPIIKSVRNTNTDHLKGSNNNDNDRRKRVWTL